MSICLSPFACVLCILSILIQQQLGFTMSEFQWWIKTCQRTFYINATVRCFWFCWLNSCYTCISLGPRVHCSKTKIGFAVGHLGQSAFVFVFAVALVADGISREDKYSEAKLFNHIIGTIQAWPLYPQHNLPRKKDVLFTLRLYYPDQTDQFHIFTVMILNTL